MWSPVVNLLDVLIPWVLLLTLAVVAASSLRRPQREDARELLAGAALLLIQVVPLALWGVAGPWAPGDHGMEMWQLIWDVSLTHLNSNPEHGYAGLQLLWLAGGWLDPRAACLVPALWTPILLWRWLRTLVDSPSAAWLGAAVVATSMPHLRLAMSGSILVVFGFYLAATAWMESAWYRTSAARFGAGMFAAAGLAVHTRAEGLVLVPLCVATLMAARGWGSARSRLGLAPALATAIIVLPRALSAWAQPDVHEYTLRAHDGLVVWAAAVVSLLLLRAGSSRELRSHPLVVTALLTLGLAWSAWVAPSAFDGSLRALSRPSELWAQTLPLFHPDLWPPLVVIAMALGLLLWPASHSAFVYGVLCYLSAAVVAYSTVATWDSLGNYVRMNPAWSWAVAAGVARAAQAAHLPIWFVLAWLLTTLVGWQGPTAWVWPLQAESRLIIDAIDRARHGDTVFALSRNDVTPDLGVRDPRRLGWTYFGVPIGSLQDALEQPDSAVGGLWLETLSCHRGLFDVDRPPEGVPSDGIMMVADDRLWTFDRREPAVGQVPWSPVPTPPVDHRNAPCLFSDHAATCSSSDSDGGCALWTCAGSAKPTRPYVDPRCDRMRHTFVLEPVHVERLHQGSIDTDSARLLSTPESVALHRIVGVRSNP